MPNQKKWPAAVKRLLVAALVALGIRSAHAFDRDPLDVPLRQYAFLLAVALLGGLVSWYAKVRSGTVRAWHISTLVGELATSAFAGLVAFWLCTAATVPPMVTAALVGVAGHMGTRAIVLLEHWAERRFGGRDMAPEQERGP